MFNHSNFGLPSLNILEGLGIISTGGSISALS